MMLVEPGDIVYIKGDNKRYVIVAIGVEVPEDKTERSKFIWQLEDAEGKGEARTEPLERPDVPTLGQDPRVPLPVPERPSWGQQNGTQKGQPGARARPRATTARSRTGARAKTR